MVGDRIRLAVIAPAKALADKDTAANYKKICDNYTVIFVDITNALTAAHKVISVDAYCFLTDQLKDAYLPERNALVSHYEKTQRIPQIVVDTLLYAAPNVVALYVKDRKFK